jgi:hypothetical protein
VANDISSRVWRIDTAGPGVIYPYQVFIKYVELYAPNNAAVNSQLAQLTEVNGKEIVNALSQTAQAGEIQTRNMENWYRGLIVPVLQAGCILHIHVK